MIRMIYNDIDRYRDLQMSHKIVTYDERRFEYLTNWYCNKEDGTTRPFRDEYSVKLLKETYNFEFFSDDDWYSLVDDSSERFSLSGLSEYMKYALILLHNSRVGVVTEFKGCDKCIWQVLSTMPFDVLIAINNTTFENNRNFDLGVDYIIENININERRIELNVLNRWIVKEDAEEVACHIYEKNNEYFISCFSLDDIFDARYYWKEHLEDIIKECKHLYKKEYPIIDKSKTWNLVDFAEKIKCSVDLDMDFKDKVYLLIYYKSDEENVIKPLEEILARYGCDDLEIKKSLSMDDTSVDDSWIEYELKSLYHEILCQRYSWLTNDLKIVTHLCSMPNETVFRKLPMLFVDKYPNGSYKIWGKLTVKYPDFHEILSDIINYHYTEECERYVTIVDVEELFDKASDIERTVCGFKITKNCIDIYDKNDAIHLFATMTQEALDSGNVEISKEFY